MAIINCPECKHKVSDKADSCPSCGFGVKASIKEKRQKQKQEARKRRQEEQERQRQEEEKKELERRMASVKMPKKPRLPIISSTIATMILIVPCTYYLLKKLPFGFEGVFGLLLSVIIIVIVEIPAIIGIVVLKEIAVNYKEKMRLYELSQNDLPQYQREMIRQEDRKRAEQNRRDANAAAAAAKPKTVKCPKCGAGPECIQAVKQWGVIMGPYSSATQRVCISCNKKF